MELTNFVNVTITLTCLGLGFLIKLWIKDDHDKFIPTLMFILGFFISFLNHGVSIESFNVGWVSALASTGLHQLVNQLMAK